MEPGSNLRPKICFTPAGCPGYNELLESGKMIGPRLFSVGRAARIPDGVIRLNNLNEARELVRKRVIMGGRWVKQYLLPTRRQRQWLQMASLEFKMNMTNEGGAQLLDQIGMIKDGSAGIEHNPIWDQANKDVIKFIVMSRTWLTPALQVSYGTKEEAKEYFKYKYWSHPDVKLKRFIFSDSTQKEAFPASNGAETFETITKAKTIDSIHPSFLAPAAIDTRLQKAGALLAIGSHGNDAGIGIHNEMWALQMGGISNMDVLKMATIDGARAIGVQRDLGSIEVGKIADLVILAKNPLDDIHNTREIKYVMKDGVLYDGDTLDMIWPVAKKCPEWKLKTTK